MNKLLIIISIAFIPLFFANCKGKPTPFDSTLADSTSTDIDTLVSDHFLDDTEPEPVKHHHSSSTSSGRSGNGGGGADSDAFVTKYKNYQRLGDNPDDYAEAIIFPAIRMVYSDNFLNPKARVLNSTMEGDKQVIDVAITWKDHWTPQYEIKGTLTVNSDGSNANFVITDKNSDAEVLEFTEENSKTEANLGDI